MASAQSSKPLYFDRVIANNESDGLFLSGMDGIEFDDYGVPTSVLSYYSVVYGLDYDDLYNTVECESGFRHLGVYGDSGKAYGISQFWESTFNYYCPDLQYMDMQDQLHCMGRMFSLGEANQWTCFK